MASSFYSLVDAIEQGAPIDNSKVFIRGPGEYEHISEIHQNIAPTVDANLMQKIMDPANGFSEGRSIRKIASIPIVAMLKAEREGYDFSDRKSLDEFLKKHPEYMTVEKIDTGATGKIIVR